MKDVLAAVDMSAGAVYNYFSSKEHLIAAIAQEALAEVTEAFDRLRFQDQLPSLDTVLTETFTHREPLAERRDAAALLVQIWAESLRSPVLAAAVAPFTAGCTRLSQALSPPTNSAACFRRRCLPTPSPPSCSRPSRGSS